MRRRAKSRRGTCVYDYFMALSFGGVGGEGQAWESDDVWVFPAPEVSGHMAEMVAKMAAKRTGG